MSPVLRMRPASAKTLVPLECSVPMRGEPVAAVADDGGDVGEGLDVVDERRRAPEPGLGGVGGARAGLAAAALDGGHERRLLAADEGACAEPDLDLEAELGLADVGTEEAGALGLADGRLEPVHRQRVLGADVDEALVGPDRIGGDGHALQDPVGVGLQHGAVHEGPGVALVGIADDVLLLGGHLGDGGPLEPRGVAAAAAPAQPAGGHLPQDLRRGHLGEGLDHPGIAADGDVALEALRVDDAGVLQHDLLLAGEEGGIGGLAQALHRGSAEAGRDLFGIPSADVAIQHGLGDIPGLDRHQGTGGAEPHAAHTLHLAGVTLADGALQGLEDRGRAGGLATRRHAHPHLMVQIGVQCTGLFGHLGQIVQVHTAISARRSNRSSLVTLPSTSRSRTTAGARPQAPTQRAVRTDRASSAVVSPGLIP